MTNQPIAPEPRPWWRYGLVWMIISGPAVVVVAGIATLVIAVQRPDPVVTPDYYRKGIEINRTLRDKARLPAMQGRNHAATPAQP